MSKLNVYLMSLIAFYVVSCAPKPPEYTEVEDQLQPYFTAFKTEAEARGVGLNLSRFKFGFDESLSGTNHAGKCAISEKPSGNVLQPGNVTHLQVGINPDRFNNSDEYGRIELVFHELGHCLLGLTHNDNQVSIMTHSGLKTMASSWMSTYHFTGYLSRSDQDLMLGYYINQLFDTDLEQEDLTQISNLQSLKTFFSKTALFKNQ